MAAEGMVVGVGMLKGGGVCVFIFIQGIEEIGKKKASISTTSGLLSRLLLQAFWGPGWNGS